MTRAAHERFWPRGLPRTLHFPRTSLWYNLEVAATRYPDKPAIVFYDTVIRYAQLRERVDRLAAFLQQRCGVRRGDRVALFSQNCPQYIVAYYAILRADAAVVPVNAMSTAGEFDYYLEDSGAAVAVVARDLFESARPAVEEGRLRHAVVLEYADALEAPTDMQVPDWVSARSAPVGHPAVTAWADALGAGLAPAPHLAGPDDLCVLPYTSGTTGHPKGCIHTHYTMTCSLVGSAFWRGLTSESVALGVAPMFHLLGMQNGMNLPICLGGTVAMLPRWDPAAAATLIERYGVTVWTAPPAMLVDFFAQPGIESRDLSSLAVLTGGGAAMPESVATMLHERFGLAYLEGYGMTETASFLHGNPPHRPKRQCLGMPTFEVDSRIVDPETLEELPQGETGELITSAPQVMLGYWNNPQANEQAFIERDGRRFLRTGDLASIDEDGYFFMRDRLKRMINASGYKVWPAEVENLMYGHPDIHEVCVIGVRDERRGETVKAFVVPRPHARGRLAADAIEAWCRTRMSAYKVPRIVEFVDALPRSATGKINWRELQEREAAAAET